MNNKKGRHSNMTTAIVVGVIVGLLVLIFGQPIKEYMNPPKPIFVVQDSSAEFCPDKIDFGYVDTASFGIEYRNLGESDATFTTEISSDAVKSKYSGKNEDFKHSSSKAWVVEAGQYQSFSFTLKKNESTSNNITMLTRMTCSYDTSVTKGVECGTIQRCCNYVKSAQDRASFNLINENCR